MSVQSKREYFDRLADSWDALPAPPDAPASIAEFVRRSAFPGGVTLDVGCGTGVLLPYLEGMGKVVELDVSEKMLAESRRKAGAGRAAFVCAAAQQLPFWPGAFDAVLCFGVLPHLGPGNQILRELLSCVRPGGLLSIGHLMGSAELNEFHAALGSEVAEDRLPSSADLSSALRNLRAEIVTVEERTDWYLVQARG